MGQSDGGRRGQCTDERFLEVGIDRPRPVAGFGR